MEWPAAASIVTICVALGFLGYVVLQLLWYGEARGVEKTELKYEVAGRIAREKADEISKKTEAEYDKTLDITSNIDVDDVNKLLFNKADSSRNTNDSSAETTA